MKDLYEALELHDSLNPKFWNASENLKPDVRQKILEIVDEFKENVQSMTEIELNPLDVYLVGSNASYNYTEYSDLDVHLVVNFNTIDENLGLVQSLMNLQKSEFNSGYDITIHDTDVEIYVEDINSSTMSNGIYSVLNDNWIKKPEPIEVPEIDIEDDIDDWKDRITDALNSNDPSKINDLIDELYILRKNGLLSSGEYGAENQTFKEIRNLGLLQDLKDSYMKLRSKELSLESLRRNKMKIYRERYEVNVDSIIGKDIWVYGWAQDFGIHWFRILRKSSDLLIVNVLPDDYTKLTDLDYPDFKEERNWSITPEQYNRVITKTKVIRDDNFYIDDLVKPRTTEELINVEDY